MSRASCGICGQILDEEDIRNHYEQEHSCDPVQECQRCGTPKLLAKSVYGRYGKQMIASRVYCDSCIEDPLEGLLVKTIVGTDKMNSIHPEPESRPVLSEPEKIAVRKMYKSGKFTLEELAEEFDCSTNPIYRAKEGEK